MEGGNWKEALGRWPGCKEGVHVDVDVECGTERAEWWNEGDDVQQKASSSLFLSFFPLALLGVILTD